MRRWFRFIVPLLMVASLSFLMGADGCFLAGIGDSLFLVGG
jgi:hypothetical protein